MRHIDKTKIPFPENSPEFFDFVIGRDAACGSAGINDWRETVAHIVEVTRAVNFSDLSPVFFGWLHKYIEFRGKYSMPIDVRFLKKLAKLGFAVAETSGIQCPKCQGVGTVSHNWPRLAGHHVSIRAGAIVAGEWGPYRSGIMPVPDYATADRAKEFLDTVTADTVTRYETYFETLKPVSPIDIFRRALFAFASVHTTWQANCVLYDMLYNLDWLKDKQLLLFKLGESRAGLHLNRMNYIWDFAQRYWTHPDWYTKQAYEDWFQYRDRLNANIKGLGLAKTAFFQELVYFEQNRVACFDVHLLKLHGIPNDTYGKSGAPSSFVRWCEETWASECEARNLSPTTARWIYWDHKQQKADSRYWSCVLEGPPTCRFTGQMLLFPVEEMVATVRIPEKKSA